MAGQAIPVDTASEMITTYSDYMTNLGVNMEEQTQSASFTFDTLSDWLRGVATDSDEIRVFMAAYPDADPKAGRTSVILWPYKNGAPAMSGDDEIPPFNEGDLKP